MKNIDSTIEQYLLGNLSADEVKAFEHEIQNNPDIKSEVNMQRNIIEAIKETKRMEIKANLAQIKPSYVSPLTQQIAIAAVSLLVVSLLSVGIYSTLDKSKSIGNEVVESVIEREKVFVGNNDTIETYTSLQNFVKEEKKEVSPIVENIEFNNTTKRLPIVKSNKGTKPTNVNNNYVDPLNLGQESDDDLEFSGKNGKLEVDKSSSSIEDTKIQYSVDLNYDFLGYKYDGKNLQLLGKFPGEAYIVEKKMNILVLRYNNKIYQIIESNKVERLDKHQITSQKIIDQLK